MSTKPAQSNHDPAVKRRRSSIRIRIAFWAGLWLALGSLILSGFTAYNTRQAAIKNSTNEAMSIAELQSGLVIDVLDPPLMTARVLATSLTSLKDPSIPISLSRDDVNAMLRKALIENPSFHGTYTLWEPNEFDGQDLAYQNAVAHDSTGRFIPYWVRGDEGIIHTEALTQYETPGVGDWYILPRSTKQEVVIAPLITSIQGQDEIMASFIVPIIENDKFYGVVGVDAPIGVMQELVDGIDYYEGTINASIFTDNGTLIAVRNHPELVNQSVNQIYPDYEQIKPSLTKNSTRMSPDGKSLQIFVPLEVDEGGTRWVIGLSIPLEKITVPATNAAVRQFTISLGYILLALVFLWFVTGQIVRPMQALTDAAKSVSQGNLSVTANVHSNDEAEVLADAFNAMTLQLRSAFSTLEQRVAERTQALANVAEISTTASQIKEMQEMLATVVHLTQRRFGLYHAHVFVLDEATEELKIAACGWKEGDVHEGTHGTAAIPLTQEQSLVARAARTRQPVIVNNVHSDLGWLPNPLLPDTASEMAVPLLVGEKLVGVMDVQSDRLDAFTEQDANVQTTLGAQVGVAMQNIQSTEIVTKRATELQTVASISTTAATIQDVQQMLHTVVHLTQRQFGLYHAHIFLYHEADARLAIAACGWKEGDPHEGIDGTAVIPLGQEQSLVARAARTRQAVIVNDVRSDPGWLPNPLLPDTASELAVPMIVGDQLLGVLDVQSERLNAFTDEDASIQTTLASQVATALQNARSFLQSQRQAERETAVNLITQKIQNAPTVEAALQIAARELGHALGMRQTQVSLDPEALAGEHQGH